MSFLARRIEGLPFAFVAAPGSCRRRAAAGEARPSPAITAVMALKFGSCRWPLGHPRAEGFRFCCAARAAGEPYCAEHGRRARGSK